MWHLSVEVIGHEKFVLYKIEEEISRTSLLFILLTNHWRLFALKHEP